jgi:hypothetical protein
MPVVRREAAFAVQRVEGGQLGAPAVAIEVDTATRAFERPSLRE